MDGTPHSSSPARPATAGSTVAAWCGAAAYPIALYVTVLNTDGERTVLRALLLAVVMLLPAGLLRRRPLTALLLMLAGSFAVTATLDTADVGYSQAVLTAVALGVVAAVERRRVSIAALVATLGTQTAAVAFYTSVSGDFLTSAAFVALAVFAAWTTGDSIRQRRVHAAALRSQATAQAITAERLRIARELHDLIAHSIGVIAIQAGVGSRVLDTQPVEARNALRTIEATSRQTLAELRRVLGGLRRTDPYPGSEPTPLGPAPTLADVDRVAAGARQAGVRVEVRWLGQRRPLPAHIDLSAFRIVQEALTNVLRHADARECRVTLEHRDDALAIEVVDDGRRGEVVDDGRRGEVVDDGHGGEVVDDGHGGVGPGTGYGITGMRERVGLLHGEFNAGPRPEGGFRVVARLPVPARS